MHYYSRRGTGPGLGLAVRYHFGVLKPVPRYGTAARAVGTLRAGPRVVVSVAVACMVIGSSLFSFIFSPLLQKYLRLKYNRDNSKKEGEGGGSDEGKKVWSYNHYIR